jgi:DNA-binding NarL/FixJ family response regulator
MFLSDREMEVLHLTALGHSNKAIADELTIAIKTVETYKARGMEKLGFRGRVDVIRYAQGKGWLDDC